MENTRNRPSEPVTTALEACLERHVTAGQRVVVGLSGGIDSVVLLDALTRASASRFLAITAVYVHHGLSANADAWESHCHTLCRERDVGFSAVPVAVERGSRDGLEAAARRARHAIFTTLAADWIALGHHRDDQAETLLFNLVRGTGLRGAGAMREANGRLLRPLLGTSRDEIRAYARNRGLVWIEDESNADSRYSRNYLRHKTLAELTARFPGSVANLAGASRRFAEAESLLDELARLDLGTPDDFPVEVARLSALAEPRARNVLRYLLQRRHIGIPSEERLREALRQLTEAAPDRHPAIVFGAWCLRRRRHLIVVEPAQGG